MAALWPGPSGPGSQPGRRTGPSAAPASRWNGYPYTRATNGAGPPRAASRAPLRNELAEQRPVGVLEDAHAVPHPTSTRRRVTVVGHMPRLVLERRPPAMAVPALAELVAALPAGHHSRMRDDARLDPQPRLHRFPIFGVRVGQLLDLITPIHRHQPARAEAGEGVGH